MIAEHDPVAEKLDKSCSLIAFSIFDWVEPWIGVKNQLTNFAISFVYIWSTLKKKVVCRQNVCMCVWVSVCVSVCLFVCELSIFCHAITRKRLHSSLWNIACMFVYVFSRTLSILAMICWKLSVLENIVVFAQFR